MRILMTGATGFIGKHLCRRLVADGHSITALVRNPERARGLPATGMEYIQGDLTLFKDERRVLPSCDAVIHLAGIVAAPNLATYDEINFVAVKDLVSCIERQSWKPRRFLFASSLAAGGPSQPGERKTEADAAAPTDAYGQAKWEAEKFLQNAPFPTTSFRPALVFGPEDTATLTLFQMAKRGFGFGVAGRNAETSFVYVGDLVDALVRLLDDETRDHRTYYVSYPEPADNRALWRALGNAQGKEVRVLPIPKVVLFLAMLSMTGLAKIFRFQNQLDRKQFEQITATGFACSSAALTRDFAWTPTYDLRASIAAAVEGFQRGGTL